MEEEKSQKMERLKTFQRLKQASWSVLTWFRYNNYVPYYCVDIPMYRWLLVVHSQAHSLCEPRKNFCNLILPNRPRDNQSVNQTLLSGTGTWIFSIKGQLLFKKVPVWS
jgi:hypothetical protein